MSGEPPGLRPEDGSADPPDRVESGEWTFINRDEQEVVEGLSRESVGEWRLYAQIEETSFEIIAPDGSRELWDA